MDGTTTAAPAPSLGLRAGFATATARQCSAALLWTLGLVGLFAIWWVVERELLRVPRELRFVHGAAVVPMIVLGVPHIAIGFTFLATSRKVRTWRSATWLVGLVALGVGLCFLYHASGGRAQRDKLPIAAVTLYFLIHQLRDETFFYRALGDVPADVGPTRAARFLDAAVWILIVVLAGVGAVLYDVHAHGKSPPRAGPLDYLMPDGVGEAWRALAVGALVLLFVRWRLVRWGREGVGGFLATARRHPAMLAVYLLLVAVALLGSLSGTFLAAIVLWHVLEWYLFASRQAKRREATGPAPRTLLDRVKGTRKGFVALHLGLSAVVFALMLVWNYRDGRAGALSPLVSVQAFDYWTIMHVTVSFFPR